MNTNRTDVAILALVGDGSALAEALNLLAERPRPGSLRLGAVVERDGNPTSPALEFARALGVPLVTTDLADLADGCRPNLVLVLTDDRDLVAAVRDLIPPGTPLLEGDSRSMLATLHAFVAENRALQADSHRLKETRLRLNQFVETAPLAIYIKDTDLRYRRVNSHAMQLLGLKEHEIAGRTDHTIYPDGGARWLQKVERETLATRETLHATGVLPVQGRDLHVQITLFPVIENGEVEGLYGLVEDATDLYVSEQKLHEVDEQLTETQSYLREVLENSRDMIFLTDPTGILLSFNSGAENALGYSRDELVGTPAHRLCSMPGNFERMFSMALREGHAASYEVEFRSKDLRPVVCNISLTLIESPDGKPLEVVCICRDITTRLRLKEDLIRSERLAAVGQMASGVAHEINNPLAVIDTIAGLVEETLADDGAELAAETKEILARAMERLHHQVKRCTAITHSLLGFVRKTQTGIVEVDLTELLEESLELLGTELRRSRIRVDRHFTADLPPFRSDPMLLQQVFVNLIKNAADAMEDLTDREPRIEIVTSRDAEYLIVSVEDNGVGIPDQDRERIFDLFHTTKPVGKGTGLGLSIVHDILYRLGGTIRVASEPGKWARFVVSLPLEPPKAPRPDPSSIIT